MITLLTWLDLEIDGLAATSQRVMRDIGYKKEKIGKKVSHLVILPKIIKNKWLYQCRILGRLP